MPAKSAAKKGASKAASAVSAGRRATTALSATASKIVKMDTSKEAAKAAGTAVQAPLQEHPSFRYVAPNSITKGLPLKLMMSPELVDLIAETFDPTALWHFAPAASADPTKQQHVTAAVDAYLGSGSAGFNRERFLRNAKSGLDALELTPRSSHIARALAAELPDDFSAASRVLCAAFGPVRTFKDGESNGMQGFFFLPHASYLAEHGAKDLDAALDACYALTQRFTAEFAIRPLIEADQKRVLATLDKWASDPSSDVRRLVSEGTRPRLPWARVLRTFVDDPTPVIPLLDRLKTDDSLYVRRSVANHVGDIAKDNLDIALDLCDSWLAAAKSLEGDGETDSAKNLRWVIRHALRHPVNKLSHKRATKLRNAAE